MKYDFPLIKNISDVLPAIEGSPEFIVADRDDHLIVNYNVNMADTFPPIKVTGGSPKMRAERSRLNALRRECRGIIFDKETGDVIRRPYHKFFNVGERDEVLPTKIDLSQDHVILEKLDGSFIVPYKVAGGRQRWGTKMGETDVAKPVLDFVNRNPLYIGFADAMLDVGLNPIFEWCSRRQKIVIDHPEDQLILTGIRDIETGQYYRYDQLLHMGTSYSIPVVRAFDSVTDIEAFIEYARGLQDTEGFVIRFADGHMLKLKCDWYVQIHKAKEKILFDRHVVEMILDGAIDDVKPHLQDELAKLEDFEARIGHFLDAKSMYIANAAGYYVHQKKIDRKTFALEHAASHTGLEKSLIFKLWDVPAENGWVKCRELLIDYVRQHLGSNAKYDQVRDEVFEGLKFNEW